jgi:hypothetical protein
VTRVRVNRDLIDRALSVDRSGVLAVCIPVVMDRPWEPPQVSEARIMWNATQREPYWPDPAFVGVEFDVQLLDQLETTENPE